MINLNNKFWVVGTNPYKYYENFLNKLNSLEILDDFFVEGSILKYNDNIFDFGSKSTLNQNLIAWESFGFIITISHHQKYKKSIPLFNEVDLFDISFYSLFIPSLNPKVKLYRESIIWKLIYLVSNDLSIVEKYKLHKTRGYLEIDNLKNECGIFERKILENIFYKKIIKNLFEEMESE